MFPAGLGGSDTGHTGGGALVGGTVVPDTTVFMNTAVGGGAFSFGFCDTGGGGMVPDTCTGFGGNGPVTNTCAPMGAPGPDPDAGGDAILFCAGGFNAAVLFHNATSN